MTRHMKKYVSIAVLALFIAGCDSDPGENPFGIDYIPYQDRDNSEKWGFIDFEGNVILEPDFRNVTPFFEGYALISNKKGYYDFLDKNGEEFDERFYYATPFHDGMAATVNHDEHIKYINTSNEVVLDLKEVNGELVEEAGMFFDGLAKYKTVDGKWGYVNEEGVGVIAPVYDYARSFSEGMAVIGMLDEDELYYEYGVINKDGDVVFEISDDYDQLRSFKDGMMAYQEDDGWGFMNAEFEVIVKPEQDWGYILDYFNGYATFEEDDEWGLIDKEGNKVIRARYDNPLLVSDGLIAIKEEGEWGFMNLQGEDVIEPWYEDVAMPFVNGTAIVRDGRDYVFINKQGDQINDNEYNRVYHYMNVFLNTERTVYSDYFDPDLLLATLIEEIEVGRMNGLDEESLLEEVMDQYEDLELPSERDIQSDVYSYMYLSDLSMEVEPQVLNVGHDMTFTFDRPIIDVTYNYDRYQYEYDYNDEVYLTSISFEIYSMGREERGEDVAEALRDLLKDAGFWYDKEESSSTEFYFRNDEDDDQIRIGVTFTGYSIHFTYYFEGYNPDAYYWDRYRYDDYYYDDYYYDDYWYDDYWYDYEYYYDDYWYDDHYDQPSYEEYEDYQLYEEEYQP